LCSANITYGMPFRGSGPERIRLGAATAGRADDTGSMPRRRSSLWPTVRRLLNDLVTFVRLCLTSHVRLTAEKLFLRKQLGLYQERHTKPKRPDEATRIASGAKTRTRTDLRKTYPRLAPLESRGPPATLRLWTRCLPRSPSSFCSSPAGSTGTSRLEENRVLRAAHGPRRFLLTDDQRRR
jgi:hypothetical protein